MTSTDCPSSEEVGRASNRSWPVILLVLGLAAAVAFSLLPALFAPVSADDRYWSLETPARYGSYAELVVGTWEDNAAFVDVGRVSTLGRLARRLVHKAVFDVARLTSTSIVNPIGGVKLALLLAAAAASLAFVKSLRWRASDGRLIRVGRASLLVVGTMLMALLAGGVQTHAQFRNGWVSYAPHTYLAIAIIFGTAGASVVLARRVADRMPAAVPTAVGVSILFAVIWNWTYELNYMALPLAVFAVVVFPLTSEKRRVDERRARLIAGGSLIGSWLTIFAATRAYLSGVCTGDECYVGTTLSLGPDIFSTWWFNLASSLPGTSGAVFTEDLDRLGMSHLWSQGTPGQLWVVSLALSLCLAGVWLWASRRWPVPEGNRGAERSLLLRGALGSFGVGLGAALIMSLSAQSQEVISTIGLPYRHTVLTWAAIALTVALVGRAIQLSSTRSARLVAIGTVIVLVFIASVYTLPRNLVSTQAYRIEPGNRAIADVHFEVVAGDLSNDGHERRCHAFERAETHVHNRWVTQRLEPAADVLFRRLHGEAFCGTSQP